MNENDQENDPATEAEPSEGPRILGNSWTRGQASKSHGIVKPQRRATQRTLGGKEVLRNPLGDISKQLQALAGNMDRALEQQAQNQQQARQGDLETLWTQFIDVMDGWKAEQQIREEHFLGRITSLELEVGKLRTELTATTQQHPKSPLPAPPAQEHRPPSRAAGNTTGYQAPEAPSIGTSKTARQPVKLGASYEDMAALMATRPGGQEWQVVGPKQKNKAQKSSTARTPGEPNTSQKSEDLNQPKRRTKRHAGLFFEEIVESWPLRLNGRKLFWP